MLSGSCKGHKLLTSDGVGAIETQTVVCPWCYPRRSSESIIQNLMPGWLNRRISWLQRSRAACRTRAALSARWVTTTSCVLMSWRERPLCLRLVCKTKRSRHTMFCNRVKTRDYFERFFRVLGVNGRQLFVRVDCFFVRVFLEAWEHVLFVQCFIILYVLWQTCHFRNRLIKLSCILHLKTFSISTEGTRVFDQSGQRWMRSTEREGKQTNKQTNKNKIKQKVFQCSVFLLSKFYEITDPHSRSVNPSLR